ncbi:MAG: 2-oxoglutarate dehydrogenase complex E2 component [Alyxoria varia]|nr:MAG: 2-oxoglutarate dehydrogenase complex E2 component [Alyxoria varia]
MAESISEGTLKQFSKSVGDFVEQDEEIATIETDKIDVAVNAPEAGTIKELLAKEEDTVTVGQDLVKLEPGGAPAESSEQGEKPSSGDSRAQKSSTQPSEPSKRDDTGSEEPKGPSQQEQSTRGASPQEQKPPPSPSPEPTQEQSTRSASSQEKKPSPSPSPKPNQEKAKDEAKQPDPKPQEEVSVGGREERRVKMNRMRLRIAERLKQSQNTAASLTTFQKVDMHSLMEFRKLYKDDILRQKGVKLGFMSAFTRASILAMKEIPAVNASIEGAGGGDTIVYRDYVDVSVAVATEKGLVTPVVRNAEALDLVGIEKGIADLGKKGGVFGSLFGTPIINLPQTAVLGLHAINDEVVVVNGKFEARPIMYLALTYDHRLLDGREAVTFLVKVKQYIEDPRRMLLG